MADALGITRRRWVLAIASIAGLTPAPLARARQSARDLETRIARVIREYESQGWHRTGTHVDRVSGDWLAAEARQAGVKPSVEPFALSRIDPQDCRLIVDGRRIEGLPLFDGAFTDAGGIRGRLGPLASDADIGLVEVAPNGAGTGAIGEARRAARHRAIVCITRGGRPGLCPGNADAFLSPFGPPVLQVSSEESAFLAAQATRRADAQVIATVARIEASAVNVTASITGRSSTRPLVVMTPRSGWYACGSERGGGLACWLELMRALGATRPARDVHFVASSGHELGHLGIDAYVRRRPALVKDATAWIHLGANVGAAVLPGAPAPSRDIAPAATVPAGPGNTIQASDDQAEAILGRALAAVDIAVARRVPRGTVPAGEAEVVHRGGGRYVSAIGANAFFHHPEDRGPTVVDIPAIARFSRALSSVARTFLEGAD
jgi:hypothetical protein